MGVEDSNNSPTRTTDDCQPVVSTSQHAVGCAAEERRAKESNHQMAKSEHEIEGRPRIQRRGRIPSRRVQAAGRAGGLNFKRQRLVVGQHHRRNDNPDSR